MSLVFSAYLSSQSALCSGHGSDASLPQVQTIVPTLLPYFVWSHSFVVSCVNKLSASSAVLNFLSTGKPDNSFAQPYWLKEPIGWSEKTESPSIFYNTKKKTEGQKAAIYWGIPNIVHVLSVLYLYEHIPKSLEYRITKKKDIAEKFLNAFFVEVQKDTSVDLPTPRNWLTPQGFLSEEKYFQKIQSLLNLIET
jgi:hypothetical protein